MVSREVLKARNDSEIHIDNDGLRRRNAALEVIGKFKDCLGYACHLRDVQSLVRNVRDDLARLQCRPIDRRHLAKSLCQVATAVRQMGWPGVGQELLEWAIAKGVSDEHVLTEILQCHVHQSDLDGAERVLRKARILRLAGPVMYSVLIDGLGRAHSLEPARRMLEEARTAGLDSISAYTTLVDSYGRAGHLQRARELLEVAKSRYGWSVRAVTAMVNAYGRAGALGEAQALFDDALTNNAVDKRTCTALMSAYGAQGDLRRAEQVFDLAVAHGLVDRRSRTTLMSIYGKVGRLERVPHLYTDAARLRPAT